MDPKTSAKWRRNADQVVTRTIAASTRRYGTDPRQTDVPLPGRAIHAISKRAGDGNIDTWGRGLARAAAAYHGPKGRFGAFGALRLKATRLGHALATEQWDALSHADLSTLCALDFKVPAPGAASDAKAPRLEEGDVFVVEFDFPYSAKGPLAYRGRGQVGVARLDHASPVPKWSLPTPAGPLTVMAVGRDLYRPLLKPGTWTPATEADFVRACSSPGVPWPDNPFEPDRTASLLALDEYAWPADDVGSKERQRSLEAALARAGTLASIGGVVYRMTEAPEAVVSYLWGRYEGPAVVAVGWGVEGLCHSDEPSGVYDIVPSAFWGDSSCLRFPGTLPALASLVADCLPGPVSSSRAFAVPHHPVSGISASEVLSEALWKLASGLYSNVDEVQSRFARACDRVSELLDAAELGKVAVAVEKLPKWRPPNLPEGTPWAASERTLGKLSTYHSYNPTLRYARAILAAAGEFAAGRHVGLAHARSQEEADENEADEETLSTMTF